MKSKDSLAEAFRWAFEGLSHELEISDDSTLIEELEVEFLNIVESNYADEEELFKCLDFDLHLQDEVCAVSFTLARSYSTNDTFDDVTAIANFLTHLDFSDSDQGFTLPKDMFFSVEERLTCPEQ